MQKKCILVGLLLIALLIPLVLLFQETVIADEEKAPQVIKIKTPKGRGPTRSVYRENYAMTVVVELELTDVSEIAEKIFIPGQFNYEIQPEGFEIYPYQFAIDILENIYIADVITNSIAIFTKDGTFIKQISIPRGKGNTEITGIDEIAVDDEGIYISNTKIIKKYDFKGNYLATIHPEGMKSEEDVDILINYLRILPKGQLVFTVQKNWEPLSTQIFDQDGEFVKKEAAYYFVTENQTIVKVLNAGVDVDQLQVYSSTETELQTVFNLHYSINTARCYIEARQNEIYFYELDDEDYLKILAVDITTQNTTPLLKIEKSNFKDDERFMTNFKVSQKGNIYFMQRNGTKLRILRYQENTK